MVRRQSKIQVKFRTILYLFLGLVVILIYPSLAWSDEGHPHKQTESSSKPHEHPAPHGGKIATLGSHYVEVVEAGNMIKIFLYDSEDKPVAVKGIRGEIHLTFPDNHRETLELVPAADQTHLSAIMRDQGHPNFKAILSLVINGQRQNIRLNL